MENGNTAFWQWYWPIKKNIFVDHYFVQYFSETIWNF